MSPSIATVGPQATLTIPESASNEDSISNSSSQMDSEVKEATETLVPSQGPEENGDESSKTAGGSITDTDDNVKGGDNDSSTFKYPRYLPKGRPNKPSGVPKLGPDGRPIKK